MCLKNVHELISRLLSDRVTFVVTCILMRGSKPLFFPFLPLPFPDEPSGRKDFLETLTLRPFPRGLPLEVMHIPGKVSVLVLSS